MLWVPVASVEVVYFAAPALTGTVFSVVVPSLKVTVPVELPLNGGLIVAVKGTAGPCGAGCGERGGFHRRGHLYGFPERTGIRSGRERGRSGRRVHSLSDHRRGAAQVVR